VIARRAVLVAIALAIAGAIAAGPALADDDDDKRRRGDRGGTTVTINVNVVFEDHDRVVVRDWYGEQVRGGHCPPGLAKKKNGCLPPGQAKKKWQKGKRLPREVIFHDLPPPLVHKMRPPPQGTRYVRIANDILMIAVGTGLVLDAIEDLGRM
jgi:Ni/Co efflux regulator RcnB